MTTEQMRKLKAKGLTYQQIADKAGVSRQHIHARLNYYGTEEYNRKKRIERHRREGK